MDKINYDELIKGILKSYGEVCKCCKDVYSLGGGYYDCDNSDYCLEHNYSEFKMNINEMCHEYDIDIWKVKGESIK